MRKNLKKQQLNQFYQPFIKPVVQKGFLIYGSTSKSNIGKIDFKINIITRVSIFKKKFELVHLLHVKTKKINSKEPSFYELLKTLL